MQNKKYGEYGGQYVAESLMNVLKELESAYNEESMTLNLLKNIIII